MSTILIIIFFGIDLLTTNIFIKFLNFINSAIIDQGEIRLSSTFGYGNTFAAVVTFGLILNVGLVVKSTSKKYEFVFGSISFIYMASFILSYSRIMYIIFVVLMIVYLIVIKEKIMKLKIMGVLGISAIYGIIYSKIFMTILNTGSYKQAWIWLFIFSVMCGISILLISRLENKIKNVPLKKIGYVLIVMVGIVICFIIYALNKKSDLVLFNTNNNQEVVRYIYNVSYQEKCVFEFDIEANSFGDNSLYEIEIVEKNKYFDDIKSTVEKFGDYQGWKKIEVELDNEVEHIYIYIRASGVSQGQYLKIKGFKMNDKEIIINHKYLPTNLVTKITSINLKHKSAWERLVFIEDAFKIIKDNWLTGIGGNGWEYRQGLVQEYNYHAKEVHCYPIQIFLEYGILAIISWIVIIIIIGINTVKNVKKLSSENKFEYITILIACSSIFLHSLLDFDMTFMFVMYIMFIYLGIIRSIIIEDDEKKRKVVINNYIKSVVSFVLIGFVFYLNLNEFISAQILYPKIKYSNITFSDKIEIIKQCEKCVPYNYEYKMKKLKYLEINKDIEEDKIKEIALEEIETIKYMLKYEKEYNQTYLYKKLVDSTLDIIDESNLNLVIDNLYLSYKAFKENPVQQRYSQDAYIQRMKYIAKISEELENKYEKIKDVRLKELSELFNNINVDEYDTTIKVLENYSDCRITKEKANENIKELINNEWIKK